MAGGMPWAARVARQPAIASRMLSRASAFGPSLRDAAGDRRALDDEHAGFVRLQRHEELHTWILSRCGSSSNFPLSPSPSFARNGQAGRPVLPPAGHDYFLLGVEADGVFAVGVEVAEEGVFPAGEGEERHGGGDSYVDADHADFAAGTVLAGGLTAGGEDGGGIAQGAGVH